MMYDGYVLLAHKGLCPVLVPTSDGLFAAVIAPLPSQVAVIEDRPGEWLVRSVQAVRDLAVQNGFEVV